MQVQFSTAASERQSSARVRARQDGHYMFKRAVGVIEGMMERDVIINKNEIARALGVEKEKVAAIFAEYAILARLVFRYQRVRGIRYVSKH